MTDINEIRNRIVNITIIAAAILASPIQVLSTMLSVENRLSISFLLQSIIYANFIFLTIRRKKLSINFKVISLMTSMWLVILSGLIEHGLLTSTKLLIIFIPILVGFISDIKKTIITFAVFLVTYSTIAYLFISGQLTYNFEVLEHLKNVEIWFIDIFYLIAVSLGAYLFGNYFINMINKGYADVKDKNLDLQDREEKYRILYETSNDAIILMEKEVFFDCNERTLKLFGCTREEIIGQKFFNFHTSEETRPKKEVDQIKKRMILASSGDTQYFDTKFLKKSGTTFYTSVSLNVVILNNKKYIQAVLRDITQQKRYQQSLELYQIELETLVRERTQEVEDANSKLLDTNNQLQQQKQELEDTVKRLETMQDQLIENEKLASVGMLAAGVAHEINNPMNFIQGGLQVLKDEIDAKNIKNSTQLQKLLDGMDMGVNRIVGIVNGLNQFNRNSEKIDEACNIHEIIDNCLAILYNNFKKKINLTQEYCDLQGFTIIGNEGKLHQVILNLLSNSEQAIEEEGNITVSTELLAQEILIQITDTGCGIPQEVMTRIKDPFFTTKDPGKGTGLGLSISNNIIAEHRGSLELKSSPNGTTALIKIPISKEKIGS